MNCLTAFILAFLALLFQSLALPKLHLFAFSPFLAFVYMRGDFLFSLWMGFLSGLVIDLLSSQLPFGLHALSGCIASFCLFHQRRHFFEDKIFSLFFFTAIISLFFFLNQGIFFYLFGGKISFDLVSISYEWFMVGLLNGLYALLWFALPLRMYQWKLKKRWV